MAGLAVRRHGPRAVRRIAVAVAAVLAGALGGVHGVPLAGAQPAPAAAELERARALYASAEAALRDGRFDDAVRDYGAAHELSKDPALFFKIGRASEGAGRCEVAIIYYRRYLREGNPTEQFATATQDRIRACGGDRPEPAKPAEPPAGTPGPPGEPATAAGAPAPAPATAAGAPAPAATADRPPAPLAATPNTHHKVAWLLTGSALALGTLGGVLAFAANSSESDVRDLYLGFAGEPVTFDGQTRARYDELIAQGRRYERLSWVSFGLTAAAAAGAAVLFVLGDRDEAAPPRVVPVLAPTGAGVAVRF